MLKFLKSLGDPHTLLSAAAIHAIESIVLDKELPEATDENVITRCKGGFDEFKEGFDCSTD
jgi:hypothetical protein